MSNTINVNYMTGMVNSLAKSVSPKTAPSVTFGGCWHPRERRSQIRWQSALQVRRKPYRATI